eukprot:12008060-Prorocentrum_lima.AAC.1
MTDWRARLVPAAAVIPAPIAYISVVAVKTSVVELKARNASDARSYWGDHPQGWTKARGANTIRHRV